MKSPEEKKKPSDYNYLRISVMVTPEIKHEWDRYADLQNQTLSSIIREAMQLLIKINRRENIDKNTLDQKLEDMQIILEEKLAEYSAKINTIPQQAEFDESSKDQLKIKILEVLEQKLAGLKPKVLGSKCQVDEFKLLQIIAEMHALGLVQITKGFIVRE